MPKKNIYFKQLFYYLRIVFTVYRSNIIVKPLTSFVPFFLIFLFIFVFLTNISYNLKAYKDADSDSYTYLISKKNDLGLFYSSQRPPVFPIVLLLLENIKHYSHIDFFVVLNSILLSMSFTIIIFIAFSQVRKKINQLILLTFLFILLLTDVDLIQFLNFVIPEILLVFLISLHVLVVFKLKNNLNSVKWTAIFFVSHSFLVFTKPIFIFFPILSSSYISLYALRMRKELKFTFERVITFFVLGLLFTFFPIQAWNLRNYKVFGTYEFSYISDINLTGKILEYNLVSRGPTEKKYNCLKEALTKQGNYKDIYYRFDLIFACDNLSPNAFAFMGEYSKQTIQLNTFEYFRLSGQSVVKIVSTLPPFLESTELYQSGLPISQNIDLFYRKLYSLYSFFYYPVVNFPKTSIFIFLTAGFYFSYQLLISKKKEYYINVYLFILIFYFFSCLGLSAYDSYYRLKAPVEPFVFTFFVLILDKIIEKFTNNHMTTSFVNREKKKLVNSLRFNSIVHLMSCMLKKSSVIIHDKKQLILITLMTILSLFSHFYHFSSRRSMEADMARDLLVSYHIEKYRENVQLGHTATGLSIVNKDGFLVTSRYPPFYYYFLSFLWIFLKTPSQIIFFSVFAHALSVITFFFLTKELSNTLSGSIAGFFYAAAQSFMWQSYYIIGLQFAIPYFLISFLIISFAFKRNQIKLLLGGLLLLVLLSTFHYSVLVFIPPILVLVIVKFKPFFKSVSILAILLCWFLFIHFQIIHFFGFWSFINSFIQTNSFAPDIGQEFISKISQMSGYHFNLLFPIFTQLLIILSVISILVSFLLSKSFHVQKLFLIFVGMFYILLGATKSGLYLDNYLLLFEYLFIILLSISIGSFYYKAAHLHVRNLILFLGSSIIIFSLSNKFLYLFNFNNTYNDSEEFAKITSQEIKLSDTSHFSMILSSYYSPYWETSVLGFWLEQSLKTKIYKISDSDTSFQEIENNPTTRIFICQKFDDIELTNISCIKNFDEFTKKYPDFIKQNKIIENKKYKAILFSKSN